MRNHLLISLILIFLSVCSAEVCTSRFQCFDGNLICANSTCRPCETDQECQTGRYTTNKCFQKDAPKHNTCGHKDLLPSLDQSDIIDIFVALLGIMVSAPAGVGGGGILVPLFILFGKFTPHGAIPLSKATIFGGALSNNIFNLRRRHPTADRPIIDFDAVSILEPPLLLGTVAGVLFNTVAPSWLLTCLLVVTLSFTAIRSGMKAVDTYRAENPESVSLLHSPTPNVDDPSDKSYDTFRKDQGHVEMTTVDGGDVSPLVPAHSPLGKLLARERRAVPAGQVIILAITWVVVAVTSILRGGVAKDVVPCAGSIYWLLVLFLAIFVFLVTAYQSQRLQALHKFKIENGYVFHKGDVQWDRRRATLIPAICTLMGFFAGSLGIAAGTVLTPVMFELGILSIVASSTSGFMVLFTASSTTLQYVMVGSLKGDYAILFILIGSVAGGLGNFLLHLLLKRSGKTWFIIGTVAVVIGVSTLLMGVVGTINEVQEIGMGKSAGFRPLCNAVF